MNDKNEKNRKLGSSLVESIRSPELADISQDIGEITLDALLEDGVLKELPVIRIIIGLAKTGITFKDRIFVNKIIRFLEEIDEMTPEELESLDKKIEEDEKFQERIGETLLIILDRYDHMRKPRLLAKLFRGYLRHEIDYDRFQRFAVAVDRAYIGDLDTLLECYTVRSENESRHLLVPWERLYSSGLASLILNVEIDRDTKIVRSLRRAPWSGSPDEVLTFSVNRDADIFTRVILQEKHVRGPLDRQD